METTASTGGRRGHKIRKWLETGRQCRNRGDLKGAVRASQKVLSLCPENAPALDLLGVSAYQVGDLEQARMLIQRAIAIDRNHAGYHKDLGNVYKRLGQLDAAEDSLLRSLSLSNNDGRTHYDLGIVYQIEGRLELALDSYRSCVRYNPKYAAAWNNMGLVHQSMGNRDASIECFESAIVQKPDFAGAYNNLGNLFRADNKLSQAVRCYRHSLAIDPGQNHCYTSLGSVYQSMRQPSEALACYRTVIQRQPDIAAHWVNLGTAFHDLDNFQQAVASYKKALAIDPDLPQAYLNLGLVYKVLGRSNDALACFESALRLDPNYGNALNHLLISLYSQCEWERLKHFGPLMTGMTDRRLAKGEKPFEDPFLNLIRQDSPQKNYRVARAWSQAIQKKCRKLGSHHPARSPRRKIRVGYLSANFRNHPGADLILGVLDHHDRNAFEVYGYSWGKEDGSPQRKRIIDACDKFVDINLLDDFEAANRIRSDQVDILVDLLGYLKNARLSICAHRPAPIQVRFLGFVGTSGADFIDYMISDAVVTPTAQQRFFSEKLVLMPDCYLVNNYARDNSCQVLPKPSGKDKNPFVFCCFNTAYKLDADLFAVWMAILRSVPNSVLWLMPESSTVKRNLVAFARKHGVDADRLVFKDKVSKKEHLDRLSLSDLALDTQNVNGVASTGDALWAGLPVITRQGDHFASRISSSLLHAIGLSELVTRSLDDYAAKAIQLATDRALLSRIRKRLEANRRSGPLFDTERFVHHLEAVYRQMWKRHVSGCAVKPITFPKKNRWADSQWKPLG